VADAGHLTNEDSFCATQIGLVDLLCGADQIFDMKFEPLFDTFVVHLNSLSIDALKLGWLIALFGFRDGLFDASALFASHHFVPPHPACFAIEWLAVF
jgi:hypothetical protein